MRAIILAAGIGNRMKPLAGVMPGHYFIGSDNKSERKMYGQSVEKPYKGSQGKVNIEGVLYTSSNKLTLGLENANSSLVVKQIAPK